MTGHPALPTGGSQNDAPQLIGLATFQQDTALVAPGPEVTISRNMPLRRLAGQSDVGLTTPTDLAMMRKRSPSFHRPARQQ
jgi:hypothetical protein